MELTLIIFFRGIAVFIALLMAFFAYKIYSNTKGATKGWLYLSLAGILLFIWSSTALLFSVFDILYARILFGVVSLLLMAFFVSVAYTKLAGDFNAGMPKWITPKLSGSLVIVFFLVMLGFNYFTYGLSNMELFFRAVLSSAKWMLGVIMLYTCIPTFYIMKSSKNLTWVFAFLFCLFVGLGLNIGQYHDGCCWSGGESKEAGLAACDGYGLDYVSISEMPCVDSIVGAGKMYQLFLLVGLIVGDISFYKIWRTLTI